MNHQARARLFASAAVRLHGDVISGKLPEQPWMTHVQDYWLAFHRTWDRHDAAKAAVCECSLKS